MRQQFKWMMNHLCPFPMDPISWGMGTKHQNSVLILLGVQHSSWLFRLVEYCNLSSFPSVLKVSPSYSMEPALCYLTRPWGIGFWWTLPLLVSAPRQIVLGYPSGFCVATRILRCGRRDWRGAMWWGRTQPTFAGFEDGEEPWASGCEWPLEGRKGKERNLPWNLQRRM